MPDTTATTPAVRLKSAVRARSLASEGVALSMGATAVVVRGSRADTVWRALEPALRAGFHRSELLGRFPEAGRPFLAGILDQLEEHRFLRDLEPEPASLTEAERAAYPHLESVTHRPYAALAALRTSVVRVRSSCPLLEARVRRALARAGFGEVHADTGPVPEAPVLLTARLSPSGDAVGAEVHADTGPVPEAPVPLTARPSLPGDAANAGSEHVVAAGDGLWLTGPRDRPGTPDLSGRLRAWFAGREESGPDRPEPDAEALGVTRSLVAAQLTLALVAQVARGVSAPGSAPVPGPGPEFMVTTDELVSEPHTLLVADPLDPRATRPLPRTAPEEFAPAEPLEVPDRLDAVTHLWDRVFGPVGEPAPGDLSQLPVGLARSGRLAGYGLTTALARENALVNALNAVVWDTHETTGPADGGTDPETPGTTDGTTTTGSATGGWGHRADGVDLRAGHGSTTVPAREDDRHEAVWAGAGSGSGGPDAGRSPSGSASTPGLGIGLTQAAAIGAAVGDLVLRAPDTRWKDVDPPSPSPTARRLWAALTLRFGVSAELTLQELDGTGVWRARVTSEGRPLSTGAAPDPVTCVETALLQAVARVRLAEEAPDAVLPPFATGAPGLARWALDTGAVRVEAPGGADSWRALGVHSAVAAWT
ncbi:hypothetical protein [Nocardiopsis eucommiae]|uniref:hypothetical protein n=1 Tax=Nocardiopsis eucommiae TaxID=2831970 RepID=UPI003D74D81A